MTDTTILYYDYEPDFQQLTLFRPCWRRVGKGWTRNWAGEKYRTVDGVAPEAVAGMVHDLEGQLNAEIYGTLVDALTALRERDRAEQEAEDEAITRYCYQERWAHYREEDRGVCLVCW